MAMGDKLCTLHSTWRRSKELRPYQKPPLDGSRETSHFPLEPIAELLLITNETKDITPD